MSRDRLHVGLELDIAAPAVVASGGGGGGGGGAAPTYFDKGTASAQGSAGTAPQFFPAGIQANDIAILFAECGEGATPVGLSDAQGFVEGSNSGQTPDANVTTLRWWWKRLVGGDTPPTIEDDGLDNHKIGQILVFRGASTSSDPVVLNQGTAASSTTVSIPGGTTPVDNCLVIAAVAYGTDLATPQFSGESNADLTGVVERADFATALGGGGGCAVVTGAKAVAGAFGATAGTLAAASVQAYVTLALRPA